MLTKNTDRLDLVRSAGSAMTAAALAAAVLTSLLPGAAFAQRRTPAVPKVKDAAASVQDYRRLMHLQNYYDYLYSVKAQKQIASMPKATRLGPGNKTSTRATDIAETSGKWVLRGPTRMIPPYNTFGITFNPRALGNPNSYISGRSNAVAIDPTSRNGLTAYLATAGGGVWKTVDGGNNWQPSGSNSFPIQQTSSVAINPRNGLIIYVGLGDFNDTSNGFGFGTGIMRTNNGGATWVNVGAALMQGTAVSAIVVDEGNPQIVTATCGRGTRAGAIYRSVDGGNTFSPVTGAPAGEWSDIEISRPDSSGVRHYYATRIGDGVYRSDNQGAAWVRLPVPLVLTANSSNIDVTPSATDPLSVTVLEGNSTFDDARAWKSSDLGATWREITGNLLINAAISGSNWNTSPRAMVLRAFGAPQINPSAPSTQDLVFAGGRTLSGALGTGAAERVWTDIGLSISSFSQTHADQQDIAQNPLLKTNFLLANDGGVYGLNYSPSGNANLAGTWGFPFPSGQQLNATLSISQFVTADFARDNPSRMMGGTLNNGVAKSEGPFPIGSTLNWAAVTNIVPRKYFPGYPNLPFSYRIQSFDDYGAAVAFNPVNSNRAFSYTPGTGNWPDKRLYYTEDNWGSALDISPDQVLKDPNPIRVSIDANAVDAANNNATPLYVYPFLPLTSSTLASDWIADQRTSLGVLTVSPTGGPLYTGGQYLWRFDPGIAETLPNPPTAPAVAYPANGRWRSKIGNVQFTTAGSISAISVAQGGGIVYVGTTDGQVWLSRNPNDFNTTSGASTATFTRISGPSLPARPITSISINPIGTQANLPNTDIVVTLGGIGAGSEGHVYRAADTTAANVLFTKQDGLGAATLPNVSANYIDRDPDDPTNTWYVATDLGVFTTINGGSSWSDASTPLGLPNVECTTLKVIRYSGTDKRLNLATFGRGFYQFDLGNATVVTAPANLSISPAYVRAGNQIFVTLNVRNSGGTATNARVTAAGLSVGTTNRATTTALPVSLGTIGNNDNKTGTVVFPGSVGGLGTSAVLTATVSYTDSAGTPRTFTYTSPRTRLP